MADYIAMQARLRPKKDCRVIEDVVACNNEHKLHDAILSRCRDEHWLVIHSRMDMPATVAKGVPDFIILGDKGRLFMVECKSRTGKLKPEQMGFRIMAEHLGHTVHIVRSFTEFLALINL